jgi:hypothetical protein
MRTAPNACRSLATTTTVCFTLAGLVFAQGDVQTAKPSVDELQRRLTAVEQELAQLRAQGEASAQREKEAQARYQSLLEEIDAMKSSSGPSRSANAWYDRITLGGYGEIHYNNLEQPDQKQIDIARFVAYVGYRFNDWIQMHSEVEIQRSLVSPDGSGELSIEQLHFDFLFNEHFNVRAGRFLVPLGIINKTHEPPTFNGVERPDFETFVIPTTWMSDGAGVFGDISERVKYELYVGSSLDGSKFDPVTGIREGRQEGVAGLGQAALTGRIDYSPVQSVVQSLRVGASFFGGGVNNGENGVNPGIDADIQVYSADFQYSVSDFDFRGVYAFEKINGAASIGNNVASEIDGYYLEGAYHFWPDDWKTGRLERSDAIVFLRYDDVDTQKAVPAGETKDPRGKRNVWTTGLSFFPTDDFVIKTDYQVYDDDTPQGLSDRFNIGLGFRF